MKMDDFLKTLDERKAQDIQDAKDQQHTQAISDAITTALKPFTENPPKVQAIIPKIDKLPDVTAVVDHTPVIEAINTLSKTIHSQPLPRISAPKVHVEVPPLDVTPIRKAIAKLQPKAEIDLSSYRAQDIDEMEQGVQYIGFVNPKGEWYIIKNEEALNRVRYVFGSANYPDFFKQAPKFVYKYLNEAIGEIQT